MKKKLMGIVTIIAIAAVAGYNVYASRAYMRKRYVGCVLSQHGAKRILQCVDLNDRQSGNCDFST